MNKIVLSHYFNFYHGFNSKNMKIVKLHRSSKSRHRIGKQEHREKQKHCHLSRSLARSSDPDF